MEEDSIRLWSIRVPGAEAPPACRGPGRKQAQVGQAVKDKGVAVLCSRRVSMTPPLSSDPS